MADVELPEEANNPFERVVALTIAMLAVVLSFVDNTGDNAKTEGIVKTNQAANKWAYFQSKSIKQNFAEANTTLLASLSVTDPAKAQATAEEMLKEVARYDVEKKEIMAEAKALEKEVEYAMSIDDRADQASLLLQIAIVICSIAILVKWRAIFYVGVVAGIAGSTVAIMAFLM